MINQLVGMVELLSRFLFCMLFLPLSLGWIVPFALVVWIVVLSTFPDFFLEVDLTEGFCLKFLVLPGGGLSRTEMLLSFLCSFCLEEGLFFLGGTFKIELSFSFSSF